MAEVNGNKQPIAPSGFYALETDNGTVYLEYRKTEKFGNPGADGAIAQGYKYVGKEDPRLAQKEEPKEEVKAESKAKK